MLLLGRNLTEKILCHQSVGTAAVVHAGDFEVASDGGGRYDRGINRWFGRQRDIPCRLLVCGNHDQTHGITGKPTVAAQPTLPLTPETAASSFPSPFPKRSLPAAPSEDKTEPQPTRDSPRFASVDPVQHGRGIGPEAGCQQDSPPDV